MSFAKLKVNDIYCSIQGEGCLTGTPMVLIRLQGCGVACPWCDTRETWKVAEANRVATLDEALGTNGMWCEVGPVELANFVRDNFPGPRWALVTGGEPADQELRPLVAELQARGYKAALETSGTALGHVGARFDWVCVSPKIGMPGKKAILADALAEADEIKHVVGTPRDIDALDRLLAAAKPYLRPDVAICLQPLSGQPKATELCTETAIRRGWRVSYQVHKLVGLR
jgi:7-carboxy-7-deazaguanine synthase